MAGFRRRPLPGADCDANFAQLCEVEELRPLERLSVAFMLVRRKILGSLLGPAGLQKLQAHRMSRSVAQSA